MCIFTQKIPKAVLFFFTKTLHFKNPHVFSQNTSIRVTINPVYTTYLCIFTQKNIKVPPVFFHKTLHFKILLCFFTKHLNPSNYKPCLYNLFVYLHKKISKFLLCFFHKTLHFKILLCFFTKHYISYQKHLNPSNYKPCLYNLFVYLYTKNTKDHPVFFRKNTTFQKSSCVLTKTLKSE